MEYLVVAGASVFAGGAIYLMKNMQKSREFTDYETELSNNPRDLHEGAPQQSSLKQNPQISGQGYSADVFDRDEGKVVSPKDPAAVDLLYNEVTQPNAPPLLETASKEGHYIDPNQYYDPFVRSD